MSIPIAESGLHPDSLEKRFFTEANGKGLVALFNLQTDRLRHINTMNQLAAHELTLLAKAVNLIEPEQSVAEFISGLENSKVPKRKRSDGPG